MSARPAPLPKSEQDDGKQFSGLVIGTGEVIRLRLFLGFAFAIVGAAVIAFVFYDGYTWLHDEGKVGTDLELKAYIARLVAHSVVSVALVFFGYTLLRAAERMFIPRFLLTGEDPVETVRAILGIDTPLRAALREVKELTKGVGTFMKAASGKEEGKEEE